MGGYSRWALIRGWALIRINTVILSLGWSKKARNLVQPKRGLAVFHGYTNREDRLWTLAEHKPNGSRTRMKGHPLLAELKCTHSPSSSRLGHKAAIKLRHSSLSKLGSSFITVLRQVFFGRPRFPFPIWVPVKATLGILWLGILWA